MKALAAALALLLLAATGPAAVAEESLRFGVLAYRPKDQTLAQWQPLAAYLQKRLGRQVDLAVYELAEMNQMAIRHGVDLVLTMPSNFIQLRHSAGLSPPLATMVTDDEGRELGAFGGAIITRADRPDITRLAHLAGKRIAAPTGESFGAYQAQAYELVEAGVPLPAGERLLLTGMPQDLIAEAVLDGRADAGFIRAGVIEALTREGRLDRSRLKVINRQHLPSYPFAVSTRLYPEWPLAVMPQVDRELATRITVALLSLPHDGPEARAMGIHGFTVPANYDAVETLLRRLRHPPFDRHAEVALGDLWANYHGWIVALGVLLVLLAATGAGIVSLYERSRRSLKETAHLAERQDMILSSLGEGVYGIDQQGMCTFINPAALSLLGLARDDAIGKDMHALIHHRREDGSPYPICECPIRRTLEDSQPRNVEDGYLREGQWFPVHLAVTPMQRQGETVGAVVAFQDISGRLAMERDLKRSNEELEQFAYVVSHDLRQPLRMITSYLTLVERRLEASMTDEIREFMDFATDGARRMDRLILDLLDYSRIGRLGTTAAPVALGEAVADALQNLDAAITESGAEVAVAADLPTVAGSRLDFVRLFQNLIGNAVKYRAPERAPRVTIDCRRDGTGWTLSVADNGIGIPPDQAERIFGVFQRLHSNGEYEGTGIGLAICRKIVAQQGGRIWVESQPGFGSTFLFTLPAVETVPAPAPVS
jgi:PAS domain S-box-containing protein